MPSTHGAQEDVAHAAAAHGPDAVPKREFFTTVTGPNVKRGSRHPTVRATGGRVRAAFTKGNRGAALYAGVHTSTIAGDNEALDLNIPQPSQRALSDSTRDANSARLSRSHGKGKARSARGYRATPPHSTVSLQAKQSACLTTWGGGGGQRKGAPTTASNKKPLVLRKGKSRGKRLQERGAASSVPRPTTARRRSGRESKALQPESTEPEVIHISDSDDVGYSQESLPQMAANGAKLIDFSKCGGIPNVKSLRIGMDNVELCYPDREGALFVEVFEDETNTRGFLQITWANHKAGPKDVVRIDLAHIELEIDPDPPRMLFSFKRNALGDAVGAIDKLRVASKSFNPEAEERSCRHVLIETAEWSKAALKFLEQKATKCNGKVRKQSVEIKLKEIWGDGMHVSKPRRDSSGLRRSTRARKSTSYAELSEGSALLASRAKAKPKRSPAEAAKPIVTWPSRGEKGAVTITQGDLDRLEEGEFLNDVIINFYLTFVHRHYLEPYDKGLAAKVHIFSTFFYKRLCGEKKDSDLSRGFDKVKKWTKNVDIFDKAFLVVPICEDAHWYLAIICNPTMRKSDAEVTYEVDNDVEDETITIVPADSPEKLPHPAASHPAASSSPPRYAASVERDEDGLVVPCEFAVTSASAKSAFDLLKKSDDAQAGAATATETLDGTMDAAPSPPGGPVDPPESEVINDDDDTNGSTSVFDAVPERADSASDLPAKGKAGASSSVDGPTHVLSSCDEDEADDAGDESGQEGGGPDLCDMSNHEGTDPHDALAMLDEQTGAMPRRPPVMKTSIATSEGAPPIEGDSIDVDPEHENDAASAPVGTAMEIESYPPSAQLERAKRSKYFGQEKQGDAASAAVKDRVDVEQFSDDSGPTEGVRTRTASSSIGGSDRKSKRLRRDKPKAKPPKEKFCARRPCILTFDSLGRDRGRYAGVCKKLMQYLGHAFEHQQSKRTEQGELRRDERTFTQRDFDYFTVKAPQQDNFCDCGVFVLKYVMKFLGHTRNDPSSPGSFDPETFGFKNYTKQALKSEYTDWFPLSDIADLRQQVKGTVNSLQSQAIKREVDRKRGLPPGGVADAAAGAAAGVAATGDDEEDVFETLAARSDGEVDAEAIDVATKAAEEGRSEAASERGSTQAKAIAAAAASPDVLLREHEDEGTGSHLPTATAVEAVSEDECPTRGSDANDDANDCDVEVYDSPGESIDTAAAGAASAAPMDIEAASAARDGAAPTDMELDDADDADGTLHCESPTY